MSISISGFFNKRPPLTPEILPEFIAGKLKVSPFKILYNTGGCTCCQGRYGKGWINRGTGYKHTTISNIKVGDIMASSPFVHN